MAVRGEAYINGHGNKLALCMIKETTLDLCKTTIMIFFVCKVSEPFFFISQTKRKAVKNRTGWKHLFVGHVNHISDKTLAWIKILGRSWHLACVMLFACTRHCPTQKIAKMDWRTDPRWCMSLEQTLGCLLFLGRFIYCEHVLIPLVWVVLYTILQTLGSEYSLLNK